MDMLNWLEKGKKWVQDKSEGMATVEIILIILVLVALALVFRETIIGFVEGLMEGLSEQGDQFMTGELILHTISDSYGFMR